MHRQNLFCEKMGNEKARGPIAVVRAYSVRIIKSHTGLENKCRMVKKNEVSAFFRYFGFMLARFDMKKINIRKVDNNMANLIVYYSRKGQNYWNGSIVDLAKGNTERVAEFVQKAIGGDLFEIETVREYSKDYMVCIEEAKAELREGARPELKKLPESIDQYDTIFVGYPNWWGTMPMCVYTFLEHFDLTGKKIVPFCTNEGSGMGGSERELKKICKGATVASGLSIHGAEAAQSENKVAAWAKKNV